MSRVREFDEEVALEKAMRLFWRRGYQASSLPDLLEATSLSRSSFYEVFGSKHQLLLAALSRYVGSGMCGLAAPLYEAKAGRAQIDAFLQNMVEHAIAGDEALGCFVNNCATELAPHDPEVREAVVVAQTGLQRQLEKVVRRAQAAHDVTPSESPIALARFLSAAVSGLNVAAKVGPSRAALEDMRRVTLRALDP